MLKWLKKSIRRWLLEDRGHDKDNKIEALVGIEPSDCTESLRSRPINVNLYRADGGWVVETINHFERGLNHDTERRTKLHLITDDQDLGESLAKIIFTVQLIK